MGPDADIFGNVVEYLPVDPAFEDVYKAAAEPATLMLRYTPVLNQITPFLTAFAFYLRIKPGLCLV